MTEQDEALLDELWMLLMQLTSLKGAFVGPCCAVGFVDRDWREIVHDVLYEAYKRIEVASALINKAIDAAPGKTNEKEEAK